MRHSPGSGLFWSAAAVSIPLIGVAIVAEDAAPEGSWSKIAEGGMGDRTGSVLLWASDLKRMLLIGAAKGVPFVQALDPQEKTWTEFSAAAPQAKSFNPYYQATYDPGTKTVYCLSGGNVLWAFDAAGKSWRQHPPEPLLEGLSWHAMACDPEGKKLVVTGSDKKPENLGWIRTLVYDIPSGKWSVLRAADERVEADRRNLVALKEALITLGGHIRLAWYRDPKGEGTDEERKSLVAMCDGIKSMAGSGEFGGDLAAASDFLRGSKLLDALKAIRALQRKVEETVEARYPVPCSRRNSPLAFDPKNRVFVLFGGDHEDYLMNDTWVLDLEAGKWKRMKPDIAPSPRAGHALVGLLRSGGVVMYEGYAQTSDDGYGAAPYAPVAPLQMWRYDLKGDRWDLLGQWPHPKDKSESGNPPPVGNFYGYASEYFSPPAMASDDTDRIFFAAHPGRTWYLRWKDFPAATWMILPGAAGGRPAAGQDRAGGGGSIGAGAQGTGAGGAAGRDGGAAGDARSRLGAPPNSRLHRTGPFVASFCEVDAPAKDMGLDKLPDNRWVRLPDAPRNPCRGCRQRDWGTAVWDSDRDQMLMWGGGHCVRSASTVAHWSPASGRIVEGFDADEPYGANGGGGFDSSVLNRPWVSVHNYNHYAYDPKCKLMVSGRGYLYDPSRMDWIRMEPIPLPFQFAWGSTVVEGTPHGAVAWARRRNADAAGLWLFDREKGWTDLDPKGKLFVPWCDSHGMVYDSKRDRMVFSSVGGGYSKKSDGTFLTFDFKTKALETITPENAELNKTGCARELAYVEHADWILIGDLLKTGEGKSSKVYTRVYDCGRNMMFLLEAGPVEAGYSAGWAYDAKRKLVYSFSFRGEAWALKIVPEKAELKDKPD
ncbi:MAG: kelch repeat-containing protein [Planctomycetota bacterium]|nr:kelch repeat-containing protein [Planctomycetota bacterium]